MLAFQPFELPLLAARAVPGFEQASDLDPPAGVEPEGELEEFAIDRFPLVCQDFQRLGGLVARDDGHAWPKHPRCFTRTDLAGPRRRFKDATETGGLAGDDGHRLTFGPDRSAEDPRL